MHTTVNYDDIAHNRGPLAAREQALKDMRDYLGLDRYNAIRRDVRTMARTSEQAKKLRLQFDLLAGISGFPVRVFIENWLGLNDAEYPASMPPIDWE